MRKKPSITADPHPGAGSLLQDEAIALAYALTAKAAEQAGVRALAIKGTVSTLHGLRPARTPADVDILIDPDGFPAFSRQLEDWGWWIRLGEFTDFPVPHHSATYIHDQWPCDIDAHHRFPGFLASPDQVFDALWERRAQFTSAGRHVPMTDWASSVAITALHSVRGDPSQPRHRDELRHLLDLAPTWTHQQRADLAGLAQATGCVKSLDLVWTRMGLVIDPTAEAVSDDALAEWRLKLDGRFPHLRNWFRYIQDGGPRRALGRAGTMLWPPETVIRGSGYVADGDLALFRARLTRLVRALWKAPRNLLAMTRGGRSPAHEALQTDRPRHGVSGAGK